MTGRREWQIECGDHVGVVQAQTIGAAWRKLTEDKRTGFAPLARFRERTGRREIWLYVTPQALDVMP